MRRNRAFTLVELLVVIGIIAMLIAILLPALSRARAAANNLGCLSRLRQIGIGMQLYAQNNNGMLPFGYSPYWVMNNSGNGANPAYSDWRYLITGAIAGGSGYQSDSAFVSSTRGLVQGLFTDVDTVANDAKDWQGNSLHTLDYSCHPRILPAVGYGNTAWTASWDPYSQAIGRNEEFPCYKFSRIKRASEVILIMDGTQITSSSGSNASINAKNIANFYLNSSASYLIMGHNNWGLNQPFDAGTNLDAVAWGPQDNWGNIRWRHNGDRSANFLFVDGHAESRQYNSRYKSDLTQDAVHVNR